MLAAVIAWISQPFFIIPDVIVLEYSIVPFLTAVDIDPYVIHIFVAYAIVGALFGLFGGGISIGKYLNKEGENAVA